MHLDPFELHRPASVDEVVRLSRELEGGFDYLAGGTDLLPNYKMHLNLKPHLVALEDIAELRTHSLAYLGAMARLADLEVDAALASALGYFAASEPTSPSLLLIRQARETLGKNLYEVMKLLAPPHADGARVFVGPDGVFTVPVKILSNAPGAEVVSAPAEPAPSRAAALALIDAVAAHMKRAEPSSPVPYLLERAQTLASRDFVSLLSDVLSEEAFANLKKGR